MLKKDRNCWNLLIMILAWTFTSFSYYWVGFYTKYFRGSIYVNSTLMGLAGLFGVSVFGFMLKYMKNSSLFPLLFLISFLGSLGYTLTERYAYLLPMWILLMMFALSMLFSLVYYSNYYFFESQYRTRIFSICNIVSRTFTIMAPLSVELLDNPLLIIWIFSLIMIVLSLFS